MNSSIVLCFCTSAQGALVTDDTCISAYRVTVNGVVDSSVADALLLHAANDLLECRDILSRVAVKLDIADVTCICKRMIGSFDLDLIECIDIIVQSPSAGVANSEKFIPVRLVSSSSRLRI